MKIEFCTSYIAGVLNAFLLKYRCITLFSISLRFYKMKKKSLYFSLIQRRPRWSRHCVLPETKKSIYHRGRQLRQKHIYQVGHRVQKIGCSSSRLFVLAVSSHSHSFVSFKYVFQLYCK